MADDLADDVGHLRRGQAFVELRPVGEVRLLQSSSGGDPYGLSLVVDVVAGALGFLWRLIVGRGRWRVLVIERGTKRVVFSAVYKNKRVAQSDGMAQVERLFGGASRP